MLITITPTSGRSVAFRASDVAAVKRVRGVTTVHFTQGHPLEGSWSVTELHAPGLCSMLRPTLAGVIDAINIVNGDRVTP